MLRKPFLFGALLLVGMALIALLAFRTERGDTGRVSVVASFYPMAEFARQVGGSRVLVTTLVGPGVEPHDYEPTPRDVARLYDAKLAVYNGGVEPWAEKLKADLAKQGVVILKTTKGLPLLATSASKGEAAATDPHVWLSPVLAARQVTSIEQALIRVDPAGATLYRANAAAYRQKLTSLDHTFRAALSQCQLRTIVTSHQAFAYLANEYGLTVRAISGLSPDDEPSPQTLAELANLVRVSGITHIFFETLVNPKLANTLAREAGAQTIVFNPLEGLTKDESKAGKNYIEVQKDNLQALATALHCKQDVIANY